MYIQYIPGNIYRKYITLFFLHLYKCKNGKYQTFSELASHLKCIFGTLFRDRINQTYGVLKHEETDRRLGKYQYLEILPESLAILNGLFETSVSQLLVYCCFRLDYC